MAAVRMEERLKGQKKELEFRQWKERCEILISESEHC